MHRREALQRLENRKLDQDVRRCDSYNYLVIAKCIDEMSQVVFDSAFCELFEDYYFVFPEHHEAQIFHKDEYYVSQYLRTKINGEVYNKVD